MESLHRFSVYSLPLDSEWTDDSTLVTRFFEMVESPELLGKRVDYPLHDLQVGKNVSVYVPSAVTQKLKITVLSNIGGNAKKCPPHIELPISEIKQAEDLSEFQNIRLLLIVHYCGNNFSFPIIASLAQRGTAKLEEKVDHHFKDTKVVFFSRARMPVEPIKKKLKKIGVDYMSFMFLVNGKVVRDNVKRKVIITTENSFGTERCRAVNKQAYNSYAIGNRPRDQLLFHVEEEERELGDNTHNLG